MTRKLAISSFSLVLLAACGAGRGFTASKSMKVSPIYTPPQSYVTSVGDYQVVEGAMDPPTLNLKFEGADSKTSLQGNITLHPYGGGEPVQVPLQFEGKLDADHTAKMQPVNQGTLDHDDINAGAKVTCLADDCSDSFVDVYVKYQGQIYHQQVESKPDPQNNSLPPGQPATSPQSPPTEPSLKDQNAPAPAPAPVPQPPKSDDNSGAQQQQDPPAAAAPDNNADSAADSIENDGDDGATPIGFVGTEADDLNFYFPKTPAQQKSDDKIPAAKKTAGVYDQAIRYVNAGSLQNPVDFVKYEKDHTGVGFHMLVPGMSIHFGTTDMLLMLTQMSDYSLKANDKYVLEVKTIAKEKGGWVGYVDKKGKRHGHKSHENGLDADIAYYFKDKQDQTANELVRAVSKTGEISSNWNIDSQWDLFKFAVKSGNVDRFFVHPAMKEKLCEYALQHNEIQKTDTNGLVFETLMRLRPDASHFDHFHMRLKCSSAQPRCRRLSDPPPSTGCFDEKKLTTHH